MKTEKEFKDDMWKLGKLLQKMIDKTIYKTQDVFTISEEVGFAVYNLWIFNKEKEDLK